MKKIRCADTHDSDGFADLKSLASGILVSLRKKSCIVLLWVG